MIVINRRLFWKVYLTLLSSLVAVAVLMGGIWWLLGETPRERWDAFRIHVADELRSMPQAGASEVAQTVNALGGELARDISVYDGAGALVALRGRPIGYAASGSPIGSGPHHLLRIDLPDGRRVLARLRLPPSEPGLRILTVVLVVAGGVGLAAYPMTARLTRQLEGLRAGMARWGEGALSTRVDGTGSDEVALVARTFNAAADRLEALLRAQKALLANASHELRSPLGRLRIAVELWLHAQEGATHAEIVRNLAEIDQLVEEILLSSRLDHVGAYVDRRETVDLLGLAAEEAARVGASLEGSPVEIDGNATLLRRLMRNLLENATRHGLSPVDITVAAQGREAVVVVSDCGAGIAPEERERVFEPFYRPAGRSEFGGGWGLGLALVRQIAARHGGRVICAAAPSGGSRFVVHLGLGTAKGADQVGAPLRRGRASQGGRAVEAEAAPHDIVI